MIEAKTDLKKGKIMKISSMAWAGFAAVIIAATPALAAEDSKALIPGDFSANVGVFSDYTFRGISQTGDEPAAQGGIDYSLDTGAEGVGLYLGVWGSNVDFSDGDEAWLRLTGMAACPKVSAASTPASDLFTTHIPALPVR